jgi:3-oxoacyl-[acyl-carrier protein] reductase
MTQEFDKKVALVTGGSRGIGRAICVALGRAGAKVAVNFLKDDIAAHSTLTEVEGGGGSGGVYQADVASEAAVRGMVKDIERTLGPIDMLVSNAGIASAQNHRDLTFNQYREIMETNVDGTFAPIMAVKDGMIERGFGSIVCITSVAGLRARPRMIPYSISKAAVIGLIRSFAAALGPEVRVNGIAPGLIQTDMTDDMNSALKAEMKEEAFLKRLGVPEDISEAVLFLLSDRASFISGQTFSVDGGRVTLP